MLSSGHWPLSPLVYSPVWFWVHCLTTSFMIYELVSNCLRRHKMDLPRTSNLRVYLLEPWVGCDDVVLFTYGLWVYNWFNLLWPDWHHLKTVSSTFLPLGSSLQTGLFPLLARCNTHHLLTQAVLSPYPRCSDLLSQGICLAF